MRPALTYAPREDPVTLQLPRYGKIVRAESLFISLLGPAPPAQEQEVAVSLHKDTIEEVCKIAARIMSIRPQRVELWKNPGEVPLARDTTLATLGIKRGDTLTVSIKPGSNEVTVHAPEKPGPHTLYCDDSDTVGHFKRNLWKCCGVLPQDQVLKLTYYSLDTEELTFGNDPQLVHGVELADDERTCGFVGIQDGSILVVWGPVEPSQKKKKKKCVVS